MIGLSKSSLSIFKDCPRCFWLDKVKKCPRPRGIMPSIVRGVDKMMKNSVEASVGKPAHEYLKGIPGAAPYHDRRRLESFRSWRTFQAQVQDFKIWGELDDLIEFDDGHVAPWDYKSNGEERDWISYIASYYQTDGDMYHAILEANGLTCTGKAYFTFQWPSGYEGKGITFQHATVWVLTDPARAIQLAMDAVVCLKGPLPPPGPSCEYCDKSSHREKVISMLSEANT